MRMPSRFGTVRTDADGKILSWEEKPVLDEYINCGFFVFERAFLDYLTEDEECDLEKEPLQQQVAAPYVPYNNPSSLKMRPRADSTALAVRATEPAGSPGREPDVLESV